MVLASRTLRSGLTVLVGLGLGVLPGTAPAQAAVPGVSVAGGNGLGTAANQLFYPRGVAFDRAGDLYIADLVNSRVQRFAPGANEGVTVAGGNGLGAAANQLFQPRGIALDEAGNLYVADTLNSRVQRWAPGATSGVTVAGGNGWGASASQLSSPSGITRDGAGNLYVADTANNRIQRFAPGATEGVTVAGGDRAGSGPDRLNGPSGLAIDGAGNLYVADLLNHRVQRFAPGSTEGVTVAGGNGAGAAADQLNAPSGVALGGAGDLYVADTGNHRVQRFAPGATTGVTVAGGNGGGPGASQLSYPDGVALAGAGDLYVADSGNHRVQRFALTSARAPDAPSTATARTGATTTTTGPLVVSFIAPFNGGAPITGYAVSCTSPDGGAPLEAESATSPTTLDGATTGKTYTCAVTATNDLGTGPAGVSAAVIVGSPPAPKLTGVLRSAPGSLRVAFSGSGDNGSPLTGFSATCTSSDGGVSRTRSWANPAAASITVTGLSVGKGYACRAQARNARGLGRASLPSRRKTA